MAIHIGELIQKEVESKRLTYKEFGAMIHRNEKTIPDIYDRPTMATDLLITICGALKRDFLEVYYTEEPLKSLRSNEGVHLNAQIQEYTEQVRKLTEENKYLNQEVTFLRELNEERKQIILLLKEKNKPVREFVAELMAEYIAQLGKKSTDGS